MSETAGENDSMNSTPGTFTYHLTTLLDFIQIKTSTYYLLLNTHLIATGFMPLDFTMLLFFGIQTFLERKNFTSDIADILHKCSFGLVIASLGVSGYSESVEIDVMQAQCILSSSCSTIRMTLVSTVTL